MTTPVNLTDLDKALLAAYRRAAAEGRVEIEFPKNQQQAHRLRFRAYAAKGKLEKRDREELTQEERDTLDAAAQCMIQVKGGKLTFIRLDESDELAPFFEVMGGRLESATASELEAMAKRLAGGTGAPGGDGDGPKLATEHQENPYYKR